MNACTRETKAILWSGIGAAFLLVGIVGPTPLAAQQEDDECMECGNDIVQGPEGNEYIHRFYREILGGLGDDTKYCDSATEETVKFASTLESRRDHDWCHADFAPGRCSEGHEVCPGSAGEVSDLRARTRGAVFRAEALASRSSDTGFAELRALLHSSSFEIKDGVLRLSDCKDSLIGEWTLSTSLVEALARPLPLESQ